MGNFTLSTQYGTDPFGDMATQLSVDMDEAIIHEATESGMFPVGDGSTRQYCTTHCTLLKHICYLKWTRSALRNLWLEVWGLSC